MSSPVQNKSPVLTAIFMRQEAPAIESSASSVFDSGDEKGSESTMKVANIAKVTGLGVAPKEGKSSPEVFGLRHGVLALREMKENPSQPTVPRSDSLDSLDDVKVTFTRTEKSQELTELSCLQKAPKIHLDPADFESMGPPLESQRKFDPKRALLLKPVSERKVLEPVLEKRVLGPVLEKKVLGPLDPKRTFQKPSSLK